jgi:transposase-like protein
MRPGNTGARSARRCDTIYTAPTIDAAEARFTEFEQAWASLYPAIIRLWRSSWEQFTPFLTFPSLLQNRRVAGAVRAW